MGRNCCQNCNNKAQFPNFRYSQENIDTKEFKSTVENCFIVFLSYVIFVHFTICSLSQTKENGQFISMWCMSVHDWKQTLYILIYTTISSRWYHIYSHARTSNFFLYGQII